MWTAWEKLLQCADLLIITELNNKLCLVAMKRNSVFCFVLLPTERVYPKCRMLALKGDKYRWNIFTTGDKVQRFNIPTTNVSPFLVEQLHVHWIHRIIQCSKLKWSLDFRVDLKYLFYCKKICCSVRGIQVAWVTTLRKGWSCQLWSLNLRLLSQ